MQNRQKAKYMLGMCVVFKKEVVRSSYTNFKDLICLLLERGEGRENIRERNNNV